MTDTLGLLHTKLADYFLSNIPKKYGIQPANIVRVDSPNDSSRYPFPQQKNHGDFRGVIFTPDTWQVRRLDSCSTMMTVYYTIAIIGDKWKYTNISELFWYFTAKVANLVKNVEPICDMDIGEHLGTRIIKADNSSSGRIGWNMQEYLESMSGIAYTIPFSVDISFSPEAVIGELTA